MQILSETLPATAPGEPVRRESDQGAWPRKAEEVAERHLRERDERARKERARFDLD